MNFYTLISKDRFTSKQIIFISLIISISISSIIYTVNYIVDPYNMTKYNILNIKYKLARDDRKSKVNYFKTQNKYDNILIGSSRVYSINPRVASAIIGGSTYNFGVGTAGVEDHLGIIKYLQRENKLPKNIIIGLDFYTFNPKIPANKHFLLNKELNFLTYSNNKENSFELFFSFDALRASIKTLKHHLQKTNKKPAFDNLGWAGEYFDYTLIDRKYEMEAVIQEQDYLKKHFYTNLSFNKLDKKKLLYYEEIKRICKMEKINLFVFSTPIHPVAMKMLRENTNTNAALNEFDLFLKSFNNYHNFYDDKEFNINYDHYAGSIHTKANAGDIILKTLLTKP